MPGSKSRDTSAAVAAAALAARKRRLERMAEELREAGWTVIAPDDGRGSR